MGRIFENIICVQLGFFLFFFLICYCIFGFFLGLYYLQATASAADPSGIRRIDVWIQSALVSSVSSAGQIIGRPVVVRQLDSVINRMQQFHNEEWHSDLEVNILSNLASISARFNSSDRTASVETQTG